MGKGRRQRTALVQLIGPLAWRHRGKLGIVLLVMPVAAGMAMLIPYLTKVAIDDYIVPAAEHGNLAGELNLFLDAGIDAAFIDYPDIGRAVCDARAAAR